MQLGFLINMFLECCEVRVFAELKAMVVSSR